MGANQLTMLNLLVDVASQGESGTFSTGKHAEMGRKFAAHLANIC